MVGLSFRPGSRARPVASPVLANGRFLAARSSTICQRRNSSEVFNADRAPQIQRSCALILSRRAGLRDARTMDCFRLVSTDAGIYCLGAGDFAAFHFQRKAILVSRIAIRRNSLWPLRQSQSLRRTRGNDYSDGPLDSLVAS